MTSSKKGKLGVMLLAVIASFLFSLICKAVIVVSIISFKCVLEHGLKFHDFGYFGEDSSLIPDIISLKFGTIFNELDSNKLDIPYIPSRCFICKL